ncbi:hypothetical protein BDW62DRAFT_160889 [Aspergillus aurantiobrunneus]
MHVLGIKSMRRISVLFVLGGIISRHFSLTGWFHRFIVPCILEAVCRFQLSTVLYASTILETTISYMGGEAIPLFDFSDPSFALRDALGHCSCTPPPPYCDESLLFTGRRAYIIVLVLGCGVPSGNIGC